MKLLTICALLSALTSQLSAVAQDQSPTAITRTRKVGDVLRMKVTATADVAGTEVILERTIKTEVKEVKKTGEIVIAQSDLGGKVNAGGQEIDIPASGPAVTTMDKLGRLVKYARPATDMSIVAPEVEQLLLVMQDYIQPEKAVNPGGSWETELPNPLVAEQKIKVKTTYVGLDKHEDAPVWKIKQTMTVVVDASGTKMTADMVFLADPTSGTPRVVEGTIKGTPTQYGPVDLKLKATLLKPDAPNASNTPR